MWRPTISSDELYHHGILGQKWGKRNGPPYPLGSGQHSASEKKAGWKKSLSKQGSISSVKKQGYSASKMNKITKKHGIEEDKYSDNNYMSADTKYGFHVSAFRDDSPYSPTEEEIDLAITNFAKVDHKSIIDDCAKANYETAKSMTGNEDLDYKEYLKKFKKDYDVHGIFVPGGGSVEVTIAPKDNADDPYFGEHSLDGEYDINFKKHITGWAMNG